MYPNRQLFKNNRIAPTALLRGVVRIDREYFDFGLDSLNEFMEQAK